MCEESAAKAEKEIQAQFGKVVDAIAARKEALLKEVAQSVSKHSMLSLPLYSPLFPHLYIFTSSTSNVYTGIAVKEMHGKLENSIKVTKQMLELGASIYPTNKNPAEAIWEVNKEKKTKQNKTNKVKLLLQESKSISIPTVTDVHIRTALPVDIITAVQHYGEGLFR